MTEWLDGYQHVVFPHSLGFEFRPPPARRVVWHTTEGSTAEGAFSAYQRINPKTGKPMQSCPHLTVQPDDMRLFQHVPLTLASYAVERGNETNPCGCETNALGVINIEVVAFAANAGTMPVEQLRWLGEDVLAPVLRACPDIPPSVYQGDHRMTETEWVTWPGGMCGHRNVTCQPSAHWDPGDLDLDVILHFALELLDSQQPKDETMPDYIIRNAANLNDPWLAVYPNGTLRWIGGSEAGALLDPKIGLVVKPLPIIDELTGEAYARARAQAGA